MRGLSSTHDPKDINKLGSGSPRQFPETSSANGRHQTAHRPASTSQLDLIRPLKRLAGALETRFGQSGQIEDLNEAIALYQVASRAVPEAERPNALHSLATALKTRSEWTGRRADLDEAVVLNREALLHSSPIDKTYAMSKLAITLHKRYVMANEDEDMDESVNLFNEALKLRASSHPDRSLALTDLASVLLTEYGESESLKDLDKAIALIREALSLQSVPHPDMLHSLADAICQRYNHDLEKPGLPRDRDEVASLTQEVIVLKRQAAERLPASHPYRSIVSHDIADSLLLRFKVLQDFSWNTIDR